MNNYQDVNQTNFAFEEPIFSDVNVELPAVEKPIKKSPKKNGKKKIIIGVVVFFLFLLISIIAIKINKKPVLEVNQEEPTRVIKNLSPLEERIENARLDLDIADPANQDLTFPPVNMELRLDKKSDKIT